MALEIKKHHHSLPVVLALFAVMALMVVGLSHSTSGEYAVAKALFTRVVDVKPSPTGLSKVSVRQPNTIQTGPDWTQAGAQASLELNLR